MKTIGVTIRLAFFGALMVGCHGKPDTPPSNNAVLASGQRVTVVEMEPDDQLFQALETFAKGEYEQSSVCIDKAAKSMRVIATYAGQKHKPAIERTADALESLARKVADNRVKDIATLYHSFGKAAPVLAGYRLNILENEDFNRSEAKSGALLKKTIDHLEHSITTYHRVLRPDEKAILKNGLLVANCLQHGDKVSEEELKTTLQNIDREIVKWNEELEK